VREEAGVAPEQTLTFINGPAAPTSKPISPSPSMRTPSHQSLVSSTRSRASPPPSSVATTMKRPLSSGPDDVDPKLEKKGRKWRFPHERPRCLRLRHLILHHHSGPNCHLIHPRTGRQRTPNTRLIHQAPASPSSPSPLSSHWYRAFPCSKYAPSYCNTLTHTNFAVACS
jgi:hypothetical protein